MTVTSPNPSISHPGTPQPAGRIWPLTKRVYREFSEDRIPTVAGGITFFALLAIFPAIAATVSLYGIFAQPADITHDVDLVSGFLPGGAVAILRAELHRLTSQKPADLNIAFVVSFVIALWSASGGFKALVEGLNVAFEVQETRSFIRQTILALISTAAGILIAATVIELGLLSSRFDRSSQIVQELAPILAWPLLFAGCTFVLAIIYRFGPDKPHPRWRWLTWGSSIASLFWMLGTQLFTWYVQQFGSYNRVYGDLGAAVGFLTWVWLSLVIVLLGAEINCELQRADSKPPNERQM